MDGDDLSHAYRSSGPDRYKRSASKGDQPYGRSSGPYERSSGYRRGDRPRRLEDILEGDELLTFDQFERYSEIDGTEDPKTAYKEYLRKHRQAALERYFFRHKGEGWLQERYDPFRSEAIEKRLNEAVATRSTAFMERFNAGTFTELVLEDGDDLHVEGERSSDTKSRSFPASMKLPDRLQGALQKRASVVTLSNISPMVTRDELEQLLKACSDKFISLELSLPMRDKGNYRMGWACFEEAVDLMPIVTEVEEKILYGDKIYCSAQKSFSLQFRIASPAFSNPDRLRRDLEQSMSLAQALDKRHEVECPLIEPLSELSEKMQLDIVILYLRQVHFVCYYSAISAQGPNDLVRLAGDLYIRPVSTEGHLDENLDSFDQSISDLEETLIHSFSPVSEDSVLEKHVAKVDEGRYRCVHCSKLFKGPDFVVKHLRLKHEDVAKSAALEASMASAFLTCPTQTAILSLTSSVPRRRRSDTSIDRPLRDRDHRSRDYRNGRSHRPPPPPRDAVQDPRRMRQYVDWDAPAVGDMEISYDL